MDVAEQLDREQGAQYGEDFEHLPEDRIQELRSLIQTFNGKRDLWARMVEIVRVTLRRYFWLGIQHGFWNADSQSLQIGPSGGSLAGENLNQEDLFAEDFNIYTANGKIFMAVFSQNAATTRMEPAEPAGENAAASIKAAEEAEKYVRIYEKYNPPKLAQMEVAQLFWTDGRVIAVTEVKDEDVSGNPVPKGIEVTEYFGVLESKVPIPESEFSKWPYCKVSKERDICVAKADNPKFAAKIQAGGKGSHPNDEIARMSRLATAENITQVSSDTLAYLVTEDRWWFRPSAFYELSEERRAFWIGGTQKGEDGQETQVEGLFPNGCCVKFFGSVFAGGKPCAMEEEVRVCHAMRGKGQSRPSLSDAMVPIQMEFNDALNMYSEMIHKCIPRTWIDAGPDEIQAIVEQISRYGEFTAFQNPSKGMPMGNNFFVEPQIDVPATFPAWIENLQGPLSNFVTGNQPALFGQQMEDQKTAKGYQMAKDQSLGLLSIVWTPYQEFASGIRAQAARSAAKRNAGKLAALVPGARGKQETVISDTSSIAGGNFLASPITDQNFPESWTERSNTWKTLLVAAATNPILAQNLQLPDNLLGMRDAIGLKDFVIEGADSRDKQLEEWAKMQEGEGPTADLEATAARDQAKQQQAQSAVDQLMPGQQAPPLPQEPPIMRSTVPVDPEAEDHIAEALECFRLLNSPEGLEIKQKNPPAWEDLKQHMLEHIQVGKAKGLIFPPPIGGPPPMPMMPPKAGALPLPPTGGPDAAAPPA